ncbi:beta strand repeat-containing protein [Sulfurimonas paralvinellae]|uniref:beta strand repeat-containing protein n=1 Tax=Sulfurimonas paralvinellae TaxID=317658 RepID=UPI001865C9AD|nr:pre-peptidase C-terminal domain-containing protein [Sulfurimonas paralvinellae]
MTPVDGPFVEDSTNAGDTVATSTANDPDGGDITYTIDDTTNYAIDASTGTVTLTAAGAAVVNGGGNLPDFTVTAASTTGQTSSATANVNPADTDTNEPLTLTVTPVDGPFVEDSTNAGDTVATSTANDPDGGDITYTIDDTTNYAIDASTGTVTLTAAGAAVVNGGGNLPDFTVTAASTTGQTSSATANVNPADTDTNEPLTLTVTPVDGPFVEDSTNAGDTVATSTANDPDGGDITYTIDDTTNYAIDASTGTVTLTAAGAAVVNGGGNLPDFTVTAASTTGQTSSATANVNPADTDTNEPLTLTVTPVDGPFVEDSTNAGDTVATSTANDPDGGDITYTIDDTTNYAIDASTGTVTLTAAGAAVVNGGGNLPDFTVTAASTTGQTSSATANVNPADTDTNEPLTLTVTPVDGPFVEDSTNAGDTVATSTANDPDGGDITYTIDDTTNYAIDASTGTVTLTAAGAAVVNGGGNLPDFTVTAASTTGQTSSATANVNPADTDTNEPLTLTVTPVDGPFVEDSTNAGDTVATSTANDPDGGDITYTIDDTTNYAIDASTGTVTLTAAGAAVVNGGGNLPDFTVTAASTTGQTSSATANVNPADTDTNEPLTLTVTPVDGPFVEDSTNAGDTVATSTANDPDGGDITYTIDDTTNYAIDASTGTVTLTAAGAAVVNGGGNLPDFTVTAASTTGQTSSATANVNPADTDTNEPLTLTVTPVDGPFVEDSTNAGDTVATSTANDPDGGDITYTIDDTTNYAIDASTGTVTLTAAGAAVVNGGGNLPDFTVTAASTTGQTSSATANVNPADTDTNEPLTLTVTPVDGPFVEDSTNAGDTVATSTANDPDGGDITYTIDDTTNYAIDASTGTVTLTAAGAAVVNGGGNLPDFTVTAASTTGQTSSATANVNPADTDTNEPLTLTVTPVDGPFVEDSTNAGDTVATSTANDPDGGDITYTIDDTTNYAIDASTGTVTLTAAGAAVVNGGGNLPDFTVTAASTTGQTSSATANVNPADTTPNDNPPVAVDDIILTTVDEGDVISIAQGILTRNDYDLDLSDLNITNTYNAQAGNVSGVNPVSFIDQSSFGLLAQSADNTLEQPADSEANPLNNDIAHAVEISRAQFGQVSSAQSGEVGDSSLPSFKWTGYIDDDGSTRDRTDQDFIKVYLYAGEKIVLDIDNGDDGDRDTGIDDQDVDTYLVLYDAQGNELARNDDASADLGGTGSTDSDYHHGTSLDAYLEHTVTQDGYYYVDATAWDNSNNGISDDDGKYDLWISIDPVPGTDLATFDYDISDGKSSDSATVSVDTIADSNQIDGTDSNEILIGTVGVVDTLNGGGGDDEIVVDGTDIVDGGTGFDTVHIDTAITLDTTTTLDFSKLDNIEKIDFSTNSHNDTITNLSLDDVLDMTDTNNTLEITGDSADQVNVDTSGWTQQSAVDDGTVTTYTYSNDSTSDSVTLIVDDNLQNSGL